MHDFKNGKNGFSVVQSTTNVSTDGKLDIRLDGLIEESPENCKDVFRRFNTETKKSLSAGTRWSYFFVVKSLAEHVKKPLREVTKQDLIDWSNTLNGSKNTYVRFMSSIKRFYQWLNDMNEGYPDNVSWIRVKREKTLPKYLITEEEIKKLLSIIPYPRDKALIFCLYESGCRVTEVLNMKVGDMVFDSYGASVVVSGKTGDRRIRLIACVPDVQKWIEQHPQRGDRTAPLWVTLKSPYKPLDYNAFRVALQRYAKKAGIDKRIYPHLLRHSRITILAKDYTESELKIMAGWVGDSRMAGTYVHLSGADIEKKILQKAGLLEVNGKREEEQLKPKPCPRGCTEIRNGKEVPAVYSATDIFCKKCGAPLSVRAVLDMEDSFRGMVKLMDTPTKQKIQGGILEASNTKLTILEKLASLPDEKLEKIREVLEKLG